MLTINRASPTKRPFDPPSRELISVPSDERNARLADKGGRREPGHAKPITNKRNTRVLLGAVLLVSHDGRADHLRGGDDERVRTGAVFAHVHELAPVRHDLGHDGLDFIGERVPGADVDPRPVPELVFDLFKFLAYLFGQD